LELVREMGADGAVDGRHHDVAKEAHRFAPDGVDLILALVGGDELERCLEALRPGGWLAYPKEIEPEPKKRRGVKFTPYDGAAGVREFQKLNVAIDAAKLSCSIASRIPSAPGLIASGER
jgi:NADPH:quinone reductase-like Zn-dependent oxidoreductase